MDIAMEIHSTLMANIFVFKGIDLCTLKFLMYSPKYLLFSSL